MSVAWAARHPAFETLTRILPARAIGLRRGPHRRIRRDRDGAALRSSIWVPRSRSRLRGQRAAQRTVVQVRSWMSIKDSRRTARRPGIYLMRPGGQGNLPGRIGRASGTTARRTRPARLTAPAVPCVFTQPDRHGPDSDAARMKSALFEGQRATRAGGDLRNHGNDFTALPANTRSRVREPKLFAARFEAASGADAI